MAPTVPSSILIIGSGVFGLSTAFELSKNEAFQGSNITLVDRVTVPNPQGSSVWIYCCSFSPAFGSVNQCTVQYACDCNRVPSQAMLSVPLHLLRASDMGLLLPAYL